MPLDGLAGNFAALSISAGTDSAPSCILGPMSGRTGRNSRERTGRSLAVRNATRMNSAISSEDAACGDDSDEEFRGPLTGRKRNTQKRKRRVSGLPGSSSNDCGRSASENSSGDTDAWSASSKEAGGGSSSEERGDQLQIPPSPRAPLKSSAPERGAPAH